MKTTYEMPEILPGDLIECLATGHKGIICETSGSDWSITPLPGARIKSAWWVRNEFKVVEKGPAHKFWAEALKEKEKQDALAYQESDLDWVIASWEKVKDNPSLTVVTTILKATRCLPDHTGFMLRGEIGLAAFDKFQVYARLLPGIELAMSQKNPKHFLVDLGLLMKINQ